MLKLLLICLIIVIVLPQQMIAQNLNDDLLAAVRKSDLEKVRSLLAAGADVNAKSPYGATPLFFACDRGNVEIVRLLLDKGADVNIRDTFYKATPTAWAMQKGNPEIIRLLLDKGAQEVEMAMTFAIDGAHPAIVKSALARGAIKQEALDKHLRNATRKGNAEIVELLKQAGARPVVEYKVDAATLKKYVATYKGESFSLNVTVKEGILTVVTDGFDSALIPLREHTFEVEKSGGITVIFNLTGEQVVSLNWQTPDGEVVLKKGEAK